MGLSKDSMGIKAIDSGLVIKKMNSTDKVIALAGNPNVGKSTVFNELTGLKQHTGNWPGKTVTNAQGYCTYKDDGYVLVDLPGCYSLMAHSAEEEVARDFICFGNADAVVVVCDATCLERNLNLVLQTLEITSNAVVCVNLIDEAKRKKINIDLKALSKKLGVPVVATAARSKKGLDKLMQSIKNIPDKSKTPKIKIRYPEYIEDAIADLEPAVEEAVKGRINARWLSLKLLDCDDSLINAVNEYLEFDILQNELIAQKLQEVKEELKNKQITSVQLKDDIVTSVIRTAEEASRDTVKFEDRTYNLRDRKIDKILTSKLTGFPIMFAILLVVFWITITGANYPSQLLSNCLFWVEGYLLEFFIWIGTPKIIYEMLVLGVYRVLAWVVSVMLPPMAIFFPLFTLLEDLGYLPRIAFNLDKCFKKCCACGKQALTMCMVNLILYRTITAI